MKSRYIVEAEAKSLLPIQTSDAITELGSNKIITDEGLHFRNLSHISVMLTPDEAKYLETKGLNPVPEKIGSNITLASDYERVLSLHHKTKKKGITGAGSKVAVLDSGCNDFATFGVTVCDVTGGYNFIDEQVGWVDDLGHGTRCCSIIKRLVAPSCEVHALKMINSFGGTTESAILTALDYCIDNQIDFINLSWTFYTEAIHAAIDACMDAGIVVCAATGNNASADDFTLLPAGIPRVAAVNAIQENRQFIYRNIIPIPGDFHGVTVACGGWATEGYNRANTYSSGWGTSFACPFFIGVLACYKEELKEPDNFKVLEYTLKRAKKTDQSQYFGRGVVSF